MRIPPKQYQNMHRKAGLVTHPHTKRCQERLALPPDLRRQFSCWGHDQRHRPFPILEWPLILDMTHHRQQESDRLTRTGFGDTDDISTRHDRWNGLRLNRCRCRVPEPFDDIVAEEVMSDASKTTQGTYQPAGKPNAPQFLTGFGQFAPRILIPSISILINSTSSSSIAAVSALG